MQQPLKAPGCREQAVGFSQLVPYGTLSFLTVRPGTIWPGGKTLVNHIEGGSPYPSCHSAPHPTSHKEKSYEEVLKKTVRRGLFFFFLS